jgi:hypothetical protein
MYDLYGQKRKVFISYHHAGAQWYCNTLGELITDVFNIATDRSMDRAIDSDNAEYVMRRIRENHISGTSCTIVLVGPETYGRKYIDWEIKATLDKQHGLLGINLPENPINYQLNSCSKPPRLQDKTENRGQNTVYANISKNCVLTLVFTNFRRWSMLSRIFWNVCVVGTRPVRPISMSRRAKVR